MEGVKTMSPQDELEDRILPWSQVKVICGLSRTTVWRMQKSGDFPASVQVSTNRVGWWQSELLAWRRARIPRRLPDPRPVPAPVVSPAAHRDGEEARKPLPDKRAVPRETSTTTVRTKRASRVPEGQTAFDFGL